jgi:hypothetical protein
MPKKKVVKETKIDAQRELGRRLEEFRPIDSIFNQLIHNVQWAEALGISRFSLGSMLRGTKEVKLTNLQQLFKALPIPQDWKYWILVGGDPPEKEPPAVEYNGKKLSVKKTKKGK